MMHRVASLFRGWAGGRTDATCVLGAGFLALLLAASAQAVPNPGLKRISVPIQYELGDVLPLDLEARGRKDLVAIEVDRSRRDAPPQVEVFRQTDDGFTPVPTAAEALPFNVTMVGVGKFQQGPGLVLLTPTGVEVRIWRDGRFRATPGMTLALESLFPKADGDPQGGVDWVTDLSGDGLSELVVPRLDGFTVVGQNTAGALVQRAVLRTRPNGELLRWYRRQKVAYDLPAVAYVDMHTPGGWKSVVAYTNGVLSIFHLNGQMNGGDHAPDVEADLQPPTVFDPKAPWDPPLLLIMAADLNKDGLLDLVFSKASSGENELNAQTRILIYYGKADPKGGIRFSTEADQVFALEGFTLPILLDLDGDGSKDLVLVNVEFTYWTMIKALVARSVSADAAYYRMRGRTQYPKQPDSQGSFSVKFQTGRFSHQPISLFGDFNGDGLPDLLLSTSADTLGVHWGRKDGDWKERPDELIQDSFPIAPARVQVLDLDGDGRDDLLITYTRDDIRQMPAVNHTFTVLLSRFGKPNPAKPAGAATAARGN